MNGLPKYVASTTLQEPLEWNATLIKGDLAEAVSELKQQNGQDLLIYGSSQLVNRLAQSNLIDEYRLMVFPVAFGRGKPLFMDAGSKLDLRLGSVQTTASGVVMLTYQPAEAAVIGPAP